MLDDKIWKAGKAIGLLKVLQEARYENTQPDGRAGKVVVVEGIMKAIVGAVYMDSGMKAVKKLVTKLSVIEAPA